MVHTFLLTFLFSYFPHWMSLVGFFIYLTVCFSLCGFAGFVCLFGGVCVTVADFSTSQHWYCYRFCSKVSSAKQHEYDGSSSSFVLIFTNIGVLCPLCSFTFGVCACLASWTALSSYIFSLISHLHVNLHTPLPSSQLWMSNIQPLWTHIGFDFLSPSL